MKIDFVKEGLKELSVNSWLHKYLKFTQGQESPTQFHIWSALSAMGSAMGRHCFIDRGFYMLYPNQYIVIAAESARCRKSTSADIAIDDILQASGVMDILREKMTTEFLCKELAQERLNNECLIYAPELATFLGASAFHTGLIPLLTSLYNCPSIKDYKTKESGVFNMTNICINLLACTTLDWMSNNMPGDTIEGGFTGRVIFVVGEDPRLRNAWPVMTEEQKKMRVELIGDIIRISKLYGEFSITDEAKKIYTKWYDTTKEPADLRLRPYEGRKGDHVLKIAMILSASEYHPGKECEYLIRGRHIRTTLDILKKAEKLMPLAFRGAAFSKNSKDIDRVLRQMEKMAENGVNKWIQHSILLKKNAHYMNKTEFKEVMDSLEDMGSIEVLVKGRGVQYRIR
jgi:hypothetical protein